jgi:DNA phosphorothioation-dependent restriction protein DptG
MINSRNIATERPNSPRRILERMVEIFTISSNGLLTITGNDFTTRSGGMYVKVFVKLTKRLAKLLSAEREVLVLFTSFTDLQVRTIITAREVINE